MNKFLTIVLIMLVVILAGLCLKMSQQDKDFGALSVLPNAYSAGVTNSSTSVTNATSIFSTNGKRMWASICNDGAGIVWIHETATAPATTTPYGGYPIASSTAYNHCYIIDSSHPYIGPVYGVSNTTTIVNTIQK